MDVKSVEYYRRVVAEHLATNDIPCRECGTPLWNHVERIAGHKFVNSQFSAGPEAEQQEEAPDDPA